MAADCVVVESEIYLRDIFFYVKLAAGALVGLLVVAILFLVLEFRFMCYLGGGGA